MRTARRHSVLRSTNTALARTSTAACVHSSSRDSLASLLRLVAQQQAALWRDRDLLPFAPLLVVSEAHTHTHAHMHSRTHTHTGAGKCKVGTIEGQETISQEEESCWERLVLSTFCTKTNTKRQRVGVYETYRKQNKTCTTPIGCFVLFLLRFVKIVKHTYSTFCSVLCTFCVDFLLYYVSLN